MFSVFTRPRYQMLRGSVEGDPPNLSILRQCLSFLSKPLPWMILSLCLALNLAHVEWKHRPPIIHDTELKFLRPLVKTIEVTFQGTLRYNGSGHAYMDRDLDGKEYFGTPSPQIDQAWSELIGDEGMVEITPEEAKTLRGKFDIHPTLGIRVLPDVVHSLHCVNHMRMILDSKYYFNSTLTDLPWFHRLHIHHCLNHLRQIIQCHGDLTPVTSIYIPSVNTMVGNFEQPHTCRDISRVKGWVAQRTQRDRHSNLDQGHEHAHSAVPHKSAGIPTFGYLMNEDARMPWSWKQSEYE